MHLLLPFVMLFGFLSILVRHGPEYTVVMPFVLLALCGWSVVAFLRVGARRQIGTLVVLLMMGVASVVVLGRFDVVTYASLGPGVLGAPLVLVVMWAGVVLASAAIAIRVTRSWVIGLLAVGTIALAWSLVVDPAGFTIGVFAYHATGVYYHVPFAQTLWWTVSVATGAAALSWTSGRVEMAMPLSVIVGPLLVLGYSTGVCIAVGAWVPALIGLVLSQLGFRSLYYL